MSVARQRLLRRSRLAVLGAVAAACLAFSGVAHASPPPDPNTVGATTISHIELNGVLATELTVSSGQDVKIKANWNDKNTSCTGCIDQLATAFAGGPAAGCIENTSSANGGESSGAGEVDLGPAPKASGTYNVVALFEESFSCGEGWSAANSTGYQVIAKITVQPLSTCGKTTIGKAGPDPLVANVKRVNRCVLGVNAEVLELSAYLEPTKFKGQQLIKGIIYADAKGKPGELKGVSEQLTFKSTNAAGWYHLTFSPPVKLTAGTYWIGTITGNTGKVAGERYDKVANAEDFNSNSYASGPSNPFGAVRTTSEEMSLYALFVEEQQCKAATALLQCV